MAGTFPGVSGNQQFVTNGLPMVGGQLSVFLGGTNTLADTFQDIGLSIPAANPLYCDQSGRLPLFFVADGTYKVRLVDKYGSISNGGFEYLQCPSIGASSSGGGGTSVDPTTVFNTGDPIWVPITGVRTGWTRMNGRTIGSATSGASERAATDCQALFLYLWNNFDDAVCPVPGGRGASAAADWAANKQITLLDMKGRGAFGVSDMGAGDAASYTGCTFTSGNGTSAASKLGAATVTIAQANLPNITLATTIDEHGGHDHGVGSASGLAGPGPGTNPGNVRNIISERVLTGITASTALGGSGTPTDKMPGAMLGT